jgi:hypothetical protein
MLISNVLKNIDNNQSAETSILGHWKLWAGMFGSCLRSIVIGLQRKTGASLNFKIEL